MMGINIERPPVADTTEGQPKDLRAIGATPINRKRENGKSGSIDVPRLAVEHLIQSAIDMLDRIDGSADAEPDDIDAEHDGCEPEEAL